MQVFDDKTEGIIANNKYYIIPEVEEAGDVIFKTSYIVASDLICSGNVTALFDLIVFGNIDVDEMDVKGKLICLGDCKINGQLMVQNTIWAEYIEAESVITHDQIVAQSMDVTSISADGSILIGRTLSVEEIAEVGEVLLCGETVFGSGKVAANSVLTVEPIDLDAGIDAVMDPNEYRPSDSISKPIKEDLVAIGLQKYEAHNDYEGYISYLMDKVSEEEKFVLDGWLKLLYQIDELLHGDGIQPNDGVFIIRFFEVCDSFYFKNWNQLLEWKQKVEAQVYSLLQSTKKKYRSTDCTSMNVGDMLLHSKYGRGYVAHISQERNSKYVTVKFVMGEEKRFVIPDSFKFLKKLQEVEVNDFKTQNLTCEVKSYSEWLELLVILERSRKGMNKTVYMALLDALLVNLGIKSKFILDRFKEKGWN